MLGFLEKLTVLPGEIVPADIDALKSQGLSDKAIADAIYVCVGFNIINRIADALNVQIPSSKMFGKAAKFLLIGGYEILSGLGFDNIRSQIAGKKQFEQTEGGFEPYDSLWKQLTESVFEGPGFLDSSLRKNVSVTDDKPEVFTAYVKKVMHCAEKITDEDIENLRQNDYTEDQIFELTVSAALESGRIRLESGLNALALLRLNKPTKREINY